MRQRWWGLEFCRVFTPGENGECLHDGHILMGRTGFGKEEDGWGGWGREERGWGAGHPCSEPATAFSPTYTLLTDVVSS